MKTNNGLIKTKTAQEDKDRVLFVLKDRVYHKEYSQSYGLFNSALMVATYLEEQGNTCKLTSVIDSNFIDKEVYEFKPSIVIIEALWVSGKKMLELMSIPRYKHIRWIIRIHSNIGFLAVESQALKYLNEYLEIKNPHLIVSFNNREFNEKMSLIYKHQFKYLPNIVTIFQHDEIYSPGDRYDDTNIINIGCFGALRTLKNQLFQAMCAILAADKLHKVLHFHINGDIANPYNSVLSNMIQLFKNHPKHHLIIHGWMDHDDFNKAIRKIDVGLQVSYTESFNIVVADFIVNDVPIIVSDAITWMPHIARVSSTDFDDVVKKIIHIYSSFQLRRLLLKLSRRNLIKFNIEAKEIWNRFIK